MIKMSQELDVRIPTNILLSCACGNLTALNPGAVAPALSKYNNKYTISFLYYYCNTLAAIFIIMLLFIYCLQSRSRYAAKRYYRARAGLVGPMETAVCLSVDGETISSRWRDVWYNNTARDKTIDRSPRLSRPFRTESIPSLVIRLFLLCTYLDIANARRYLRTELRARVYVTMFLSEKQWK